MYLVTALSFRRCWRPLGPTSTDWSRDGQDFHLWHFQGFSNILLPSFHWSSHSGIICSNILTNKVVTLTTIFACMCYYQCGRGGGRGAVVLRRKSGSEVIRYVLSASSAMIMRGVGILEETRTHLILFSSSSGTKLAFTKNTSAFKPLRKGAQYQPLIRS